MSLDTSGDVVRKQERRVPCRDMKQSEVKDEREAEAE